MHKKSLRILGLLLVFALIAVACGGDDTGTSETTTAATDAPATTAAAPDTTAMVDTTAAPDTTMAAGFEAGELGAVEIPAGESIEIRSLNAITGDVAFLGIPNQRGVELAIDDFGPVQGFDVSMGTGLDDLCSSDGGQAAAQTIVADPQIVGVIGTSCSGAAVAASPLISQAGLVMISGSNTSPSLTSDLEGTAGDAYQPGYYRTAHNDLFQGAAVADFVFNDLGLTTAAAIHDGDPYTDGLATAFANAFEDLGGTITTYTAVNKGDTDMVPVLTEVAAGSPEAVFFPIFPPEGNFIAQQVGGVSGLEDVTLLAADGMLVENFVTEAESEGVYMSGPDLRFGSNTNDFTGKTGDDFLAAYDAAYGEAPSASFWAHSYDATTMLLNAIDQVAVVEDGTMFIDRAALREALNATDLNGIIGHITCDDFGDCGAQRITIVQSDGVSLEDTNANPVFEYAP